MSPIRAGNVYRPLVTDAATGKPACPPYAGKRTRIETFQFWPSDLAAVFRKAGIPVKAPPRNSECTDAGAPDGDPPRITSPLRNTGYAIRLGRPGGNAIAFSANDDAGVRAQYWFVDDAYVGRSAPDESFGWTPPRAGTYQVRVVDDQGRSDARTLIVGLVE